MFEALWIALPVMVIILIGFFTDLKLPGNIPVGLAALLLGTAIAWIGGYMSAPDVITAAQDVAISLPTFDFARLGQGLADVAPLLATAIPLGIYNFTEGMTNVESAAVAGDEYNLRAILAADGAGAIVGSALGCPFPPAVYIGHPGWKAAGGRTSYSLASGVVIALLCFLGMFSLLGALLPLPAIVPILLYIGLLIGAQAFQEVPKAHCVAVVMAIIPNIAAWATGLMNNALAAAGTSAAQVGDEALANAGLVYHGTVLLGGGAILAGLVLGSIVAFIIDKNFLAAAAYCLAGAILGFIGLIHAEQVGWNVGGQIALGYLFAGLVLLALLGREPARRGRGRAGGPAGGGGPGRAGAGGGRAGAAFLDIGHRVGGSGRGRATHRMTLGIEPGVEDRPVGIDGAVLDRPDVVAAGPGRVRGVRAGAGRGRRRAADRAVLGRPAVRPLRRRRPAVRRRGDRGLAACAPVGAAGAPALRHGDRRGGRPDGGGEHAVRLPAPVGRGPADPDLGAVGAGLADRRGARLGGAPRLKSGHRLRDALGLGGLPARPRGCSSAIPAGVPATPRTATAAGSAPRTPPRR